MQARRGEAGATAELARRQASAEHLHFITRTFAALQLHERHAVCDTLLNMTATFLEADAGAVVLLDTEEPTVVVRGGVVTGAVAVALGHRGTPLTQREPRTLARPLARSANRIWRWSLSGADRCP